MIKHALVVLAASLAVNASAQVRVAPSASAVAWSGPVALVAGDLGMEGINQLGTVSLPRLTAPDWEGRVPALTNPDLLAPLAAVLDESTTPEAFALLSRDRKTEVLVAAAKEAEERANMKVWSLVIESNYQGIGRTRFPSYKAEAQESMTKRLYLNDRTTIGLAILEQKVHAYEKARAEALNAFMTDLPAKLQAGAFDGAALLKEKDGKKTLWLAADGDPRAAYDTPEDALDARIVSLQRDAPGPWTEPDARSLRKTLDKAIEAGDVGLSRWVVSAWERLHALETRKVEDVRLMRSAGRVLEGRAGPADVIAVEKFYRAGYDAADGDHHRRSRVLATMLAGARDLPAWGRLQEARRELSKKLSNRFFEGLLGSAGAAAAIMIAASSNLLTHVPWPLWPTLFIAAVPAIWGFWNGWHGEKLDASRDQVLESAAADVERAQSKTL